MQGVVLHFSFFPQAGVGFTWAWVERARVRNEQPKTEINKILNLNEEGYNFNFRNIKAIVFR
jgi:hypothetical protein